jgi:hypothetical protein
MDDATVARGIDLSVYDAEAKTKHREEKGMTEDSPRKNKEKRKEKAKKNDEQSVH